MLKPLLSTMTLAGLLALAGCNSDQPHPRPPIEPNAVQYGDYKQIYVDGYRLKQLTNVDESPRMDKDQFGLLHVTVPIRSVVDEPFVVQYRVTFFDASRHPVTEMAWLDKSLTPNTPDQITVISPIPAVDFRIDLRLVTDLDQFYRQSD